MQSEFLEAMARINGSAWIARFMVRNGYSIAAALCVVRNVCKRGSAA